MIGYSPAAYPYGMFAGHRRRRMPRQRWTGFGALPPPPPPPKSTPKICPIPGASGPSADPLQSTPVPPAKWTRYADHGMQETYARLYNIFRTPSVLGVKVIPEEQADDLARQAVDTIIALPQSEELQFRIKCAAKNLITGPLTIAVVSVIGLGLAGMGTWVYLRQRR